MYFRTAATATLAAATLALAWRSAPTYSLQSTGAVTLNANGSEARFGVVPQAVRGRPILIVSLGATASAGALQLTVAGDRPPAPGRYPIQSSGTNWAPTRPRSTRPLCPARSRVRWAGITASPGR
jgi:hypothetical protein